MNFEYDAIHMHFNILVQIWVESFQKLLFFSNFITRFLLYFSKFFDEAVKMKYKIKPIVFFS